MNSNVTILMVDDKKENLIALQAVLSSMGYHLVGLRSGNEVLKFILQNNVEQIGVILLDVQMADMDGYETARWIKSRKNTRDIPIIFISASQKSMDQVLYGYDIGSVDYILKPFDPELLRRKIEVFVSIRRIHQQVKMQGELLRKRTVQLEKMNKQLKKTEALARIVSDTSNDTIVTCEEDGKILSVNPAVKRMFHYSPKSLMGAHIHQLLPSIDYAKTTLNMEVEAKRKNGSTFPAEVQVGKAEVNGQLFYVYSIHDITERKQMEKERSEKFEILENMVMERTRELQEMNIKLQKSREHFAKMFISSPGLMAIRRLRDFVYIDVNESWLQFTGYSYEEVVGKAGDFIGMCVRDPHVDQLQPGKSYRNVHIHYTTKKGERREGLLSIEIIEIHGENCELSVIFDITEKINWEKEMSRLEQLNLIGEMAAGIAHEIRNPMTTIRGFLQISRETKTFSQEYIDIMLEELSRANNIITEYLSLARNKSTELHPKQLNNILQSLEPLLQAEALLSGKTIEMHYGTCPNILVDEKEIRQLILNLSINGLEAMRQGGLLTITTSVKEGYVILMIQDEGEGIKEEHLDKLGTPFFTTKERGTGLGLAVCYSIASRHRAVIEVETGERGTTFFVKFPCTMV